MVGIAGMTLPLVRSACLSPSYLVSKRRPGLTVETCIDYFYGYVAAKG